MIIIFMELNNQTVFQFRALSNILDANIILIPAENKAYKTLISMIFPLKNNSYTEKLSFSRWKCKNIASEKL